MVTSEEVVQAYIARAREVNPLLNAVVEERYEAALAEARSVDHVVQTGVRGAALLAEQLPLLGVPFTVKESIGLQVHPTEIRTSISPSSAVWLNTTGALANYATEAGWDTC
uniref:Amidase domain-containing protein n=1 Tax=Timema tahoe TaxID=61484 RepID=A0A7R9FJQ3_9NEOP|nr:unnamed protein product [Timema tahoe]